MTPEAAPRQPGTAAGRAYVKRVSPGLGYETIAKVTAEVIAIEAEAAAATALDVERLLRAMEAQNTWNDPSGRDARLWHVQRIAAEYARLAGVDGK